MPLHGCINSVVFPMLLYRVHINTAVYPCTRMYMYGLKHLPSLINPSPHSWCGGGLRGCNPPDTGWGNGDGGGGGGEEKKEEGE